MEAQTGEAKNKGGRPRKEPSAPTVDATAVITALMAQVAELTAKVNQAVPVDPEVERARAMQAYKDVPYYRAEPPPPIDNLPAGHVKVRVLKLGDGRISTGDYDPLQKAWTFYMKGDVFGLREDIAREQEDNGLLEIVP